MKSIFFPIDSGGIEEMNKFLKSPTIDVRFAFPVPLSNYIMTSNGDIDVGIGILYDEHNDQERMRLIIEENDEIDRVVALAKQVKSDDLHGGFPKFRTLKNSIQRRIWLLENFNISSKDAEVVTEILSKELWSTFNKGAAMED